MKEEKRTFLKILNSSDLDIKEKLWIAQNIIHEAAIVYDSEDLDEMGRQIENRFDFN